MCYYFTYKIIYYKYFYNDFNILFLANPTIVYSHDMSQKKLQKGISLNVLIVSNP